MPRGGRAGLVLALTAGALAGLGGCTRKPSVSGPVAAPESHFIRGNVVAVDPAQHTVMLAHEAIPGFMPAMTMEYKVADPAVLTELHAGDRITADLLNDSDGAGPTNLRLADVDVIGQVSQDAMPALHYHVPQVGDTVPAFKLLNQSGKTISLDQFHGKVLMLTFIYTRCPLSDFCPRMSRNFADIDHQLSADPALYAKTHLLSVSFDPTYDTPKVLRSYGGAYTGKYSQSTFQHWDFAAPSETELPKMEGWFDVGVTPQGKQLQHSLATVVISPEGKVLAFYPTNSWTVDDVLNVVRRAAK